MIDRPQSIYDACNGNEHARLIPYIFMGYREANRNIPLVFSGSVISHSAKSSEQAEADDYKLAER